MLRRKNQWMRLLSTWMIVCCLMTGCSGTDEGNVSEAEREKITLTICIAEDQWDDAIDKLTALYLKGHPEIQDIQWTLVRKNSYWDLMNMKLATNQLPDIMEVGAGMELKEWYPHLIPLDDLQVLDQIFPDIRENGKVDGHYYSVPQAIYGMGILYNMDMLEAAGWDRLPETYSELKLLCEDLDEAELFQFMNPYHEITTWVECGTLQMISMRNTPKLYIEHLKGARHRPIAEDEGWNDLLNFCDLTLQYGNRRPLQLDTDLARNYFYIGRYAMILNESARNLIGMRSVGQGVDKVTKIGPMLLSDTTEKNRLLMDTVRLGITEQSQHADEAKEFLEWLISDEAALVYQKQTMGIMPVIEAACADGLSAMAQDTYQYYKEGRMTPELMGYLPLDMAEATSEEWARYIIGESDRAGLLEVYEAYWKRYAENNK